MKAKLTIFDDQDNDIELPAKLAICTACKGEGATSAHLGAFTSAEWHMEDDEFKEDYLAGCYDRPCEPCAGTGRVSVLDEDRATPEQQRLWTEHQECMAEMAADRWSERFADPEYLAECMEHRYACGE